MNKRGDDYYDAEARVYSEKRYPSVAQNYTHFLFMRRRDIVLSFIEHVISNANAPRSLFEMGCADGVLLRSIAERYPNAFASMTGSDVSEPMLEAARELTHDRVISYISRESLPQNNSYTCAMEIGVGALVLDTEGELEMLARQLAPGGYLICSFGGCNSLVSLLDRGAARRNQLKSYKEYEHIMRRHFTIVRSRAYGIYMPLMWKTPTLARRIQPLAEVLGFIFPSLAHEQVYLLQKK